MQFPRIGWQTFFSFFLLGIFGLSPNGLAASDPCSLANDPYAKCFRSRLTPTIKAILVHYGNHSSNYDFQAAERLYLDRFNQEMKGIVTLKVVDSAVIPLKMMNRDLAAVADRVGGKDPTQKSQERLERLWYYYFSDADKMIREINSLLLDNGHRAALEEADIVLVISEPQFEALGFASGNYGFTEQPSEIAWRLGDGGRTEWQPAPRLTDELMHETGHLIGLDHASAHCFQGNTTPEQTAACCAKSAGREDVMSYCRNRQLVDESYYFGFTKCTKRFVQKKVVPLLLKGGTRIFQESACD